MTVGERIKNRRKELDISVDELAVILDKNRATIYRYESADIENMPVTVLEPLASALRTTPGYLMGWETYQTDSDALIVREDSNAYVTNNNTKEAKEVIKVLSSLNSDNQARLLSYAIKLLELQNEDDTLHKTN